MKAIQAFQNEKLDTAAQLCQNLLAADPTNADALNLLGGIHMTGGNLAAAIEVLKRAASAHPNNATIRSNLGTALANAGRFGEAETHLDVALARDPADIATRANLARVQLALGQHDRAARNFAAALDVDPDNVDLLVETGRAAFEEGDAARAELYLRRGLAARTGDPRLHKELVRVLFASSRYQESLTHIDAALAANSDDAALHVDRGLILSHLERYDEALCSFDRAIDRDPDSADAYFGRALVNLLLARFTAGWKDYQARQSMRNSRTRNSLAVAGQGFHRTPLPADMTGKRVLVVADQGLGDEVFFLRFANRLKERGAEIAYRPDNRLAAMLSRAEVVNEIVVGDVPGVAYDFRVAVGDLPWLTHDDSDNPVPDTIRLPPSPERLAEMRDKLASCGAGPYLGVTWRAGSAGNTKLLSKQIPMEGLARVLGGVGGSVVILQRNPADGEVDAFRRMLGRPVLDLSALNADLEAMLALSTLINFYVAVSNTNVHLRAAVGRHSHVLVPFAPEFRWMAAGPESPWFPGSPLYRQRADGDWEPALAELARDLRSNVPLLEAAS